MSGDWLVGVGREGGLPPSRAVMRLVLGPAPARGTIGVRWKPLFLGSGREGGPAILPRKGDGEPLMKTTVFGTGACPPHEKGR
jgi:hypothetical protein